MPALLELSDDIGRRGALLAWYDHHRRDLPWRDASDPYAVWISEIMLQQTRVETVLGYFERWVATFPTVHALAHAQLEDVLGQWQGLGYYSRARNLHRAAKAVVDDHDGELPPSAAELRRLPGIGPYTAGAIASIAFGQQAALVDGNVARVLARWFAIEDDVTRGAGQRRAWRLADALVPAERPGDWNQALMELGATICVPRNPRCTRCPVADGCRAHAAGRQAEFPAPRKKSAQRAEAYDAWIVADADGATLLAQRPEDGLLGGLWEPPLLPTGAEPPVEVRGTARRHDDVVHVFTHIRMTVTPRSAVAEDQDAPAIDGYAATRWVALDDAPPLSTLARKVLAAAQGRIFR